MASRPVFAFLALAFGWSWGLWLAASAVGGAGGEVLRVLAAFGPSLAGVAATWLESGADGARSLVAQLLHGRVQPYWYVLVLIGPPFLWFVAYLYVSAASVRIMPVGSKLPGLAPLLVQYFLLAGLAQELGWRGFLQNAFERRARFASASAAVGITWAAWHAPLLLPSHGIGPELALRVALYVAHSVVFARVLHATGGSLLVVALLHASVNAAEIAGRATVPALASSFAVSLVYGVYVLGLALGCMYLKPVRHARS